MSVDVVERLRLNENDWLFGQTARDARREVTTLREQVEKWKSLHESLTKLNEAQERRHEKQVEKLTKERDWCGSRNWMLRSELAELDTKLAALAEQNAKMRKALTKWRYLDGSYNWRCGHCGNEEGDEHKEGCALSLPDLASPVLVRIRADGVRKASTLVSLVRNDWASAGDNLSVQAAEYLISALDARAAELEKTNG